MCDDLEQRVISLERQNRQLRNWSIGVAAVLGVAVLAGAQRRERDPGDIKARSITIVNEDGTTVAELRRGRTRKSGELAINDANGKQRIFIGLRSDTPMLSFIDKNGRSTGSYRGNRK